LAVLLLEIHPNPTWIYHFASKKINWEAPYSTHIPFKRREHACYEPLGAKGSRWWEKKSARKTLAK
jgi:hypothetical protein